MAISFRALVCLLVAGVVGVAGCGGGGNDQPAENTISRVEVTPSAVLLDGAGRTKKLEVHAFDSSGREVSSPAVEFSSSEPPSLAVSGDGTVTATANVGSAIISVKVGSVAAPPVIATVAETHPGTLLIADEQVIDGPKDVSVGTVRRYTVVVLSATAPAPGTVVLASGSFPIAGKVVSSASRAAGTMEITLELASLDQLFRRAQIKGSFTAAQLKTAQQRAAASPVARRRLAADPLFRADFGRFRCLADYDLSAVKVEVTPSIEHEIAVAWALGTGNEFLFEAKGSIEGKIDGSVTLGAAAGRFECTAPLISIPVPITGFLAALFSPTIPIGVKFKVEPEISTNASMSYSWGGKATLVLGFKLDADGRPVNISSVKAQSPELQLQPAFANTAPRAKLTVFGGANIGVSVGNVFGSLPNALEADLGVEWSSIWGSPYDSAADAIFKTEYVTAVKQTVQAGPAFEKTLDWLGKNFIGVDVSFSETVVVGRSPILKTARLTQSAVKVGDSISLRMSLDPTSLRFPWITALGVPGPYNVREVRVYRMDYRSGSATVVATATPSNEQSDFEIPWAATHDDRVISDNGRPTFFVFVVPQINDLLRTELPIELGGVDGPTIQVAPGQALVLADSITQFAAQIDSSPASAGVHWSATGGIISQSGAFTAGSLPGAYEVRATRVSTSEVALVPVTVQAAATGFTISGFVRNEVGVGIAGANVALTVNAETYTARSDGLGFYALRLSDAQASSLPTGFVVNASEPANYHPSSMTLLLGQGRFIRNDFILQSFSGNPQLLSIELVPEVHHLGDGNFSGLPNSQFQFPRAEGALFSRAFSVTAAQRAFSTAKLVVRAKGLECPNEIRINNLLVGSLTPSDANGGFTFYEVPLDVTWLSQGAQNTFVFASGFTGQCSATDLDDFEFSNVQIQFQ